jgi:flagellar biosynthesis protein FlhB
MAEESDDAEKTEDPSQKRLDEAIKHGDVAKSQEVNTWFVTAASALVLLSFSASAASELRTLMRNLLANSHAVPSDGGALAVLFGHLGTRVIAAVAIPILLLALAAIVGNMIQHRLVWSADVLMPKLNRVSPIAGMKRLFSKQALANFIKGLLKLAIIGSVFVALMWPERRRFEDLVTLDPEVLLPLTRTLTLKLFGAVVAILAVIAAADYLFQYRVWFERQKMSLREVKEEYRQNEGDPKIKAKIRQLRAARAKKRMMAAVPKATVVITNPTHFAVALQYERGMTAPICVAKGIDSIALKIREVANEHDVAVVENPPLARALHAVVEIDQEVPAEHYRAVAEVIGYVLRISGRIRGEGR